jgi:hypothetical protein
MRERNTKMEMHCCDKNHSFQKTCAEILKTSYERLAINATIAVPYLYYTADLIITITVVIKHPTLK